MEIINLIIGPAVTATVISVIVSFFSTKKERDLKYITEERKSWRDEIRKIIADVSMQDWEETVKLLANLKVRINALGITNKSYAKDAHVWELIFKIEEEKVEGKKLLLYQRQLTEYLSLLLKMDWERAKEEIKGNSIRIFQWVCFITASICMGVVFVGGVFNEKEIDMSSSFSIGLVVFGVAIFVIPYFCLLSRMFESVLMATTWKTREKYGIRYFWQACIVGFLTFLAWTCGVCYLMVEVIGNFKGIDMTGFIVVMILYVVALLLHLIEQMFIWGKIYEYNDAIIEVKEKYDELISRGNNVYIVYIKKEDDILN